MESVIVLPLTASTFAYTFPRVAVALLLGIADEQ